MVRHLWGLAAAALLAASAARATSDERLILYRGGGEGRVTFDARLHRSKGASCNDCHLDLFATRQRGLIGEAEHGQRRACFACHDGALAFDACGGCHRR